ncbi:hypothetical protein N7507_005675 [Penicillium longicatenatum]|nr:hypothetical protein N7507_005675 [Penicillium longicatenatum]
METLGESSTSHQQTSIARPTRPGPHYSRVHNLDAKFFLNRPSEDLIPPKYLRRAEHATTIRRKPWIFRGSVEDARYVDQSDWSKVDIRYRGVFKTLAKVPDFSKGLWDGGSEEHMISTDYKNMRSQGQVVYALMITSPSALHEQALWKLPRLVSTTLEYWTGYREKHRDGPNTSGFLSLEFEPDNGLCLPILPVSTTTKEEHLISALNEKFKLILGQLLLHVRPLHIPGDKLPDQEIFLLGLHGSKLHLMRAYFPGQKISSLWCRREVPGPTPVLFSPTHRRRAQSSPSAPHAVHVENYDPGDDYDNTDETMKHSPATGANTNKDLGMAESFRPSTCRSRATSLRSPRFYGAENMERIRRHIETTRLRRLDYEPNPRTFRVLATREYDLWVRQDFTAAVQLLAALHMYLLSGEAKCGAIQELFAKHPVNGGDGEDSDSDSESDCLFPGVHAEEERNESVREHIKNKENMIVEQEERLRLDQIARWAGEDRATRLSETMKIGAEDGISSLREARKPWWDCIWDDQEERLKDRTDEDEEMNVGMDM